jgi:hypothetical protein
MDFDELSRVASSVETERAWGEGRLLFFSEALRPDIILSRPIFDSLRLPGNPLGRLFSVCPPRMIDQAEGMLPPQRWPGAECAAGI